MCLVTQSCPILCDPMDCSLPDSSVHGDSPGKNTGVGCHALLQGIFPTQRSNPGLLHYRWILYHLSHIHLNLFYFKCIYFNWRIITLQYFDDFCHASTWISCSYTCVPSILNPILSPSPSYPSSFSQNSGFRCLASYIKLTLVISFTYDNVYVPMLFTQIIPPSPSLTESKTLFFTSVSPLLPCMWDQLPSFQVWCICVNIQYLSFWLTSHCIIGSRFVYLIKIDSKVFLFIAE